MKKPNETKNQEGTKLNDFAVKGVRMFDNGNVVADVEMNGILIYGIRVVEGRNGDFLSLPQRKGSDGKYYSIVYVKLTNEDQNAILQEIERKLNDH